MNQVQSIIVLLMLIALAFFPMALRWARRRDREEPTSEPLSSVLPAPEALARHLYGEAVGWSREALEDYDHSELLQSEWRREAGFRLRRRRRAFSRA